MGQLDVAEIDQHKMRTFTRRVLADLQALELMLAELQEIVAGSLYSGTHDA